MVRVQNSPQSSNGSVLSVTREHSPRDRVFADRSSALPLYYLGLLDRSSSSLSFKPDLDSSSDQILQNLQI